MGDEKSPAFQFYPKDFISSSTVARMSLTEIGAYTLLLSHAWLGCGLPTDVAQIAKLAKVPASRFQKMWAGALSECFVERAGRLVNPRQELEREKQRAFRERQAENGKRRGKTNEQPSASQNQPSLSQASARTKETGDGNGNVLIRRSSEGGAGETAPPLDVWFSQLIADYPEARVQRDVKTQQAFCAQMLDFPAGPEAAWALLRATLLLNNESHEWRVKRMAPNLYRYLSEGRWQNALPSDAPTSESVSKSSSVTLSAAAEILHRRPA